MYCTVFHSREGFNIDKTLRVIFISSSMIILSKNFLLQQVSSTKYSSKYNADHVILCCVVYYAMAKMSMFYACKLMIQHFIVLLVNIIKYSFIREKQKINSIDPNPSALTVIASGGIITDL